MAEPKPGSETTPSRPGPGTSTRMMTTTSSSATAAAAKFPSPTRQLVYVATGALAGAATLPVEALWTKRVPSPTAASTTVLRAATRFWVFDLARSQLERSAVTAALPVPVIGGLAGAAGGVAEVCVEALVLRRWSSWLPVPPWAMGNQGAKLFCCFGTYTFLSRALVPVEEQGRPPRPFALCWVLGAVAGGVGSGVVARVVDGVRGRALWRGVVPRGAMVIGTVISVHVTSCWALLG